MSKDKTLVSISEIIQGDPTISCKKYFKRRSTPKMLCHTESNGSNVHRT